MDLVIGGLDQQNEHEAAESAPGRDVPAGAIARRAQAAQTNAAATSSSSSAMGTNRALPQKRAISPAAMRNAIRYANPFSVPIRRR